MNSAMPGFDSGAQAMRISEAISVLNACLEMFGDVPVKFIEEQGMQAVELTAVDSAFAVTQKDIDKIDEFLRGFDPRLHGVN